MIMNYIVITIDVEEDAPITGRPGYKGVVEGLPVILSLLREHGYPCTMFVSCGVLNMIHRESLNDRSIEIASHGLYHTGPPHYLMGLSNERLFEQITLSKRILEHKFKTQVLGFRAHGSLVDKRVISFICRCYKYDSSIVLFRKYEFGVRKNPEPYNIAKELNLKGELMEIPRTALKIGIKHMPFVDGHMRRLPKILFFRPNFPLIVIDIHCQTLVKTSRSAISKITSILTGDFTKKLMDLLELYERAGFKFCLMRDIFYFFKNKIS